jgi:hypothetical protein
MKDFKQLVDKAIARTHKDLGRKFLTQVKKEVRQTYNIKTSEINPTITTKLDSKNFNIEINSHRLSLSRFITSTTRQGIKVKVRRDSKKIVKGGFKRKGQIFKRVSSSAYPIKRLSTISITEMFTEDITSRGLETVENQYSNTLERNLRFYTKRG